jgi:hypothetical protein
VALTAELEPSSPRLEHPALWRVRVVVRNEGDESVRIPTALLAGPLSFELVDAAGRPVPLGPPPVPPADLAAETTSVPPGESITLEYHGDDLLPDSPPAGRYQLRFTAARIESPWVDLEVI